jgi:hypothetical protein
MRIVEMLRVRKKLCKLKKLLDIMSDYFVYYPGLKLVHSGLQKVLKGGQLRKIVVNTKFIISIIL